MWELKGQDNPVAMTLTYLSGESDYLSIELWSSNLSTDPAHYKKEGVENSEYIVSCDFAMQQCRNIIPSRLMSSTYKSGVVFDLGSTAMTKYRRGRV